MPTLPLTHHALPGESQPQDLLAFIAAHRLQLAQDLLVHGAIRFRGYALATPQAVEDVALALDPQLAAGEYLGTSPRNALTRHVHSASELPGYYPIPQHCEMSFLAHPPTRLYLACLQPSRWGGETPLCDFRLVWRDLDPAVRERLQRRGVRIVRNYVGPGSPRSLDPFALKRWDALFGTTDRDAIAQTCAREALVPEWLPGDRLRLTCTPPVVRVHPETGESAYFSHLQVFEVGTPEAELRRIAQLRGTAHARFWRHAGRLVTALTRHSKHPEDRAMDVTHLDGNPIAQADLEHVRNVIWHHQVVEPWQAGDFVLVDNRSTSHGRLPFSGPRQVVIAWHQLAVPLGHATELHEIT